MTRSHFDPHEYGVNQTKVEFIDTMVDEFDTTYHGELSIDELCLRPTEALRFCGDVRRKYGYYDLPDDIILRVIMKCQKNS